MAQWTWRALIALALATAVVAAATAFLPSWDESLRRAAQRVIPLQDSSFAPNRAADPLAAHPDAVAIAFREQREHWLGPHISIRDAHAAKYGWEAAVNVWTVVGENGDVIAAVAVEGPAVFHREAERLVRTQRYEPFLRGGRPVRVKFATIVAIREPERRPAQRVAFPEIKDLSTLRIVFERDACFGACPSYRLEIRAYGVIDYEGRAFVALLGRHRATLSRAAVQDLFEQFHRADFFWLNGAYQSQITDQPTYSIAVSFDGRTRTVIDYAGLRAGMPDVVADLEDAIDRAANAHRWTKGNAATAPSLIAEGWNFKSAANENTSMVAGLAAYGEAGALREVIALGAPVAASAELRQKLRPYGEPRTALDAAVAREDPEILQIILDTRAPWSTEQFGEALLTAAERGNIAIVGPLIDAGADPRYRRPVVSESNRGPYDGPADEGRTILMAAASSGMVDVVERILAAKPDIRARDAYGWTALHYVAKPNYWVERSPKLDRARVVALLIAAGADIHARTAAGQTPYEASESYPEIRAALAKAGADNGAAPSPP